MSKFYSDLVLDKSLIKSTGSNRVYIDNGDLYRTDSNSNVHHINDISEVNILDIDRSSDKILNWKTLKALLILMYKNNPLVETKLTQKYSLKRLIEGIISYKQGEDLLRLFIYDNNTGVDLRKAYKDDSELMYDTNPNELQNLLEVHYNTQKGDNFSNMRYNRYEYKDIMKDLLVSIIIDSPIQMKYDLMPGNKSFQDMSYILNENPSLNGSDYKDLEMRYGKIALSILYDKEVRQIINESYDASDRNQLLVKNINIINKYNNIKIPDITFNTHSIGLTPRFNISDYLRFYKIRGGKITRKYKDIKNLIYKFKPLNFKGNNGSILSIKYVNGIDTDNQTTQWFDDPSYLKDTEYADSSTIQNEYLGIPSKSYFDSKKLKYSINPILIKGNDGNIKPIIYTKSKVTYEDGFNNQIDRLYDVYMDKSQTQYETYKRGRLKGKYLRNPDESPIQMYKDLRRIHYAKPVPTDHDIQYRLTERTEIYTEEVVIPKGSILDVKIEYRFKSHDNNLVYYDPGIGIKYDNLNIYYNKLTKDCILRTIVVDDSDIKITKEGIDLFHIVIDEKRLNIYSINQNISEFNIQYCKYYFTL